MGGCCGECPGTGQAASLSAPTGEVDASGSKDTLANVAPPPSFSLPSSCELPPFTLAALPLLPATCPAPSQASPCSC